MRKQQKTAIPFESVTAGLLKDAVRVKDMREKENRYSASLIYTTHNAIYDLSEKTETCSSCLLTRSRAIVTFVNQYNEWADVKTREVNIRKAQEAEDLRITNALLPDPRTAEQIEEDARKAQEEVRRLEAGEVDIFPDPQAVTLNPLVVEAVNLDFNPVSPHWIDEAVKQVADPSTDLPPNPLDVPSEIDDFTQELIASSDAEARDDEEQRKQGRYTRKAVKKVIDDLTDF